MQSSGITVWRLVKWILSEIIEFDGQFQLDGFGQPRGFAKNSFENLWESLQLGMFGFTAVLAFVIEDLRLVEPVRVLGDRIQPLNIFYFIQISTFFHRLPLIIVHCLPGPEDRFTITARLIRKQL
jgi:hypothetical protein